jgi:hypothetical protein
MLFRQTSTNNLRKVNARTCVRVGRCQLLSKADKEWSWMAGLDNCIYWRRMYNDNDNGHSDRCPRSWFDILKWIDGRREGKKNRRHFFYSRFTFRQEWTDKLLTFCSSNVSKRQSGPQNEKESCLWFIHSFCVRFLKEKKIDKRLFLKIVPISKLESFFVFQ